MLSVLPEPRESLSPYAPRIEKIKIDPDKIGVIIGKGGETINKITSETGAEIDIKEDGLITVASPDGASIEKAMNWIKSLVEEPEVGKIYEGKVVGIKDFGALWIYFLVLDGMVHIQNWRNIELKKWLMSWKKVKLFRVKITGIDERGKINLTMIGL